MTRNRTIRLRRPITSRDVARRQPKTKPSPYAYTSSKPRPEQRPEDEPTIVYLRKNANGWWVITSRYHKRFIEALKAEVPGRVYDPENKTWRVPPDAYPILKELLDEYFKRIVVLRPRQPGSRHAQSSNTYVVEEDARSDAGSAYARSIDDLPEDDDVVEVGEEELVGLGHKVKAKEDQDV